jgi:hypothetical protein
MIHQLRSAIQQGKTFSTKGISSETITGTEHLSQSKAEEQAAVIAMKKNHPVVTVMFKDRKTTGAVRMIHTGILGMKPSHPQYVRKVGETPYAVIRSEMAV